MKRFAFPQAVEIASTARVGASTSLTVVTAGSAASLELSPAGLAVVPAAEDGRPLPTDHFLDAGLAAGDTGAADSTTAERLAHLREARAAMPGLSPAELARAFCGGAGADAVVRMRPEEDKRRHEQWGTLLTVGLDVAHRAIDHFAGAPHEAPATGLARF